MAFPQSRSMNADLNEGMTDGKYKKIVQNRGGQVDPATHAARADLNDQWFGFTEKPVKVAPDGLLHSRGH